MSQSSILLPNGYIYQIVRLYGECGGFGTQVAASFTSEKSALKYLNSMKGIKAQGKKFTSVSIGEGGEMIESRFIYPFTDSLYVIRDGEYVRSDGPFVKDDRVYHKETAGHFELLGENFTNFDEEVALVKNLVLQ